MEELLSELKGEKPDLNIEILGINIIADEGFNSLVAAERSLPWLQDTAKDAVWDQWQAAWRDVRILDSQNRLVTVFNLFEHDLSDPENRSALKKLFLAAAKAVDSDGNGIPDDWEQRYFGNLGVNPRADSDGDGRDNFTEFAFGIDPKDPKSSSLLRVSPVADKGQTYLNVTFRRRAGAILDYVVEASSDLKIWSASTTEVKLKKAPRNLCDGTGTSEVTYSLAKPLSDSQERFLRVRAVPRSRP